MQRYREHVFDLQRRLPWLRSLQPSFVALAQDFDPEDEEQFKPELKKELRHWVPVSYDWLKTGAQRAELHLQLGNEAARLVQDYCQRNRLGKPKRQRMVRLVAKVWAAHSAVATAVCAMGRRPQKNWLLGKVNLESANEGAQLFAAQNRAVVAALLEGRGFASVRNRLLDSNEHFTQDLVNYGRTWIDVMPRGARPLYDPDESEYFPVFLNAYRNNDDESRVRLIFYPSCVAEGVDAEDVACERCETAIRAHTVRFGLGRGWRAITSDP